MRKVGVKFDPREMKNEPWTDKKRLVSRNVQLRWQGIPAVSSKTTAYKLLEDIQHDPLEASC